MQVEHVMVDWLHTVDQGVAQDCIGNLFVEMLQVLPGGNRSERLSKLWEMIREFYRENAGLSQLDHLTYEMIKKPGKAPKLSSKAAECRHLVPFAAALAAQHCGVVGDHRHTVACLFQELHKLCTLIQQVPYQGEEAGRTCGRFAALYTALGREARAAGNEVAWRSKPKLHLMVELLQYVAPQAGSPVHYWTYRDEDWGAWTARAARRRGGAATPAVTARHVAIRFLSSSQVSVDA